MNFFAQQLCEYYREAGQDIPPQILAVLNKPLNSLAEQDIEVYNQQIGPYQDRIRDALRNRFRQQGSPTRMWMEQSNPYYRPIVEELAVQFLGREPSTPLPRQLAVRRQYQPEKTRKIKIPSWPSLSGISVPRISYKWVIAVVVPIVLLSVGGWLFFSATAPSRMLKRIRGEMERGEYALAIQHIEEMEERYPDNAQTEEAGEIKPKAALEYAGELHERVRFEEAIYYFGIAAGDGELEWEAAAGRAGAYLSWATALYEGAEYANGYECCESALACAPGDYDTAPIMDLRALVLYAWGDSLCSQQDYSGAAERFEKCFREWPDGGLAGKAHENFVDMTVAAFTGSPPPSKSMSAGGNVQIRLINQSDYTYECYFSGPSTMEFQLAPRERKTIYVLPGVYNAAFVIENVGVAQKANEDFTRPTSSSSWWELTLPPPQNMAKGIGYEQILARIEELKASLPQVILSCVEDLRYEQKAGGGVMSDTMAEYSARENTVYFDAALIDPEELDGVIFHEWGHAYSVRYLDAEEKNAYMELRDISPDIPWENFTNYYLSVEEDFAEVFAVIFSGAEWSDYTWYGPVDNVEAMKDMVLSAAD